MRYTIKKSILGTLLILSFAFAISTGTWLLLRKKQQEVPFSPFPVVQSPAPIVTSFLDAPPPHIQRIASAVSLTPTALQQSQNTFSIAHIMSTFMTRLGHPLLSPPLVPPTSSAETLFPSEPSWKRYAVPTPVEDGKAQIVIIIDDLGLDRKRTRRTFDLPSPLTLAFLPYARQLPQITSEARQKGHELMVHVPMEPESATEDPGPGALLTDLSEKEIRHRLNQALDSFDGYVGFNNHMGSRFTANRHLMSIVLQEAAQRGLIFLDSRTTSHAVAHLISFNPHLPVLERDVFLDDDATPLAIAGQLNQLERLAQKRGYAVGIGHPYDATIAALSYWIPTLKEKGIRLIPISALAQEKMQPPPTNALREAGHTLP